MDIKLFLESLVAGISTIAFAWYYNAPKKTFIGSFLAGAIGWFLFKGFQINFESRIIPAIIAGIAIGIIGEIFSKIAKEPVTVFIIPGILPLVPGAGMYRTMYNLVKENYAASLSYGRESLLIAGSISFGLLIATVFSKSLKLSKNRLKKGSLYKFDNKNKISK